MAAEIAGYLTLMVCRHLGQVVPNSGRLPIQLVNDKGRYRQFYARLGAEPVKESACFENFQKAARSGCPNNLYSREIAARHLEDLPTQQPVNARGLTVVGGAAI
jgi:hypothetical protein